MGKKKTKWVWCTTCCRHVEVGQPHTCDDFVEWLVDEYKSWLCEHQRQVLKQTIKHIANRSKYYTDFIGGEDE